MKKRRTNERKALRICSFCHTIRSKNIFHPHSAPPFLFSLFALKISRREIYREKTFPRFLSQMQMADEGERGDDDDDDAMVT